MLQKVIEEILRKKIIPESYRHWSELKGGTSSTVGILGSSSVPNTYVVKLNTPELITAETTFYRLYGSISLLPKVVYVDPGFRYFLYEYLPGKTSYTRGTKETFMCELVERMIRHYVQPASLDDYAWIEDPRNVKQDIDYAQSIIGSRMTSEDHTLVNEIHVRRTARRKNERLYVLHGDFGVHNFLFENGSLSGIIDPIPGLGRPLYDLLYAFCSSPDDLHLSILVRAVERMGIEEIHESDLIDDMIIALYLRLCTCLRHHPQDFPEYVKYWNEWVHY